LIPEPSPGSARPTARRGFAWLALGAAGFTVYGSLVPFEFRARGLAEALGAFRDILAAGVKIEQRSDVIANVMLGFPLGFALLGLVCADRGWPSARVARIGLYLLPVCAAFAAAVEFSQLFTAARTCSTSDILAQALGSAAGMVIWVLWGQVLTDRARDIWTRADVNAAGRMLIAYLALVAFVQTLPFDMSASPFRVYGKIRDGGVRFVPFGEFNELDEAQRWKRYEELVKLAGLFVPIGLLAAQLRGRIERWGAPQVALAALALAVGLEALQLPLQTRNPSATDALIGALAALVGWCAARVHREGLTVPFVVCWAIVWFAAMTPVVQSPPSAPQRERPRAFNWLPALPLESGDRMAALQQTVEKLVLFGLLGVVIAGWRLPPRTRRGPAGSVRRAAILAAVMGLFVSGVFENGQRWYNDHTPDITDVLLGGLGAALAVLAVSRARARPEDRTAGSARRDRPLL
jgi:VanZ family protein